MTCLLQSKGLIFGRVHSIISRFSTQQTLRPFKVLGLQQIAIGSLNKSNLTSLWTHKLGIEKKIGSYRNEKENVDEDILLLGKEGPFAVEVDLMTPLDANKKPKAHAPPLNHIGLWVDKLPEAVVWLEGQGIRFAPGGIRKGASGHDVTFIHPKGGGEGVLIELVQAPDSVIE